MTAVQTTAAVMGVIVAFVVGLVPWMLAKRKHRSDNEMARVVSWDRMAERLDSERDSLQKRLDESEERHRKEIADMEADWDRRAAAMRQQIVELQAEVDALGRQLAAALRRGGGSV